MKTLLRNYRHLSALLAVVILAVAICNLGAPIIAGVALVACWQLSQFAMSKRCGACFNSVLTPEQMKEFGEIMKEVAEYKGLLPQLKELAPGLKDMSTIEGGFAYIKSLPKLLKDQGAEMETLKGELKEARKIIAARQQGLSTIRPKGRVSDEAALQLGAWLVFQLEKRGKLDMCVPDETLRKSLCGQMRSHFGLSADKALSTTEVPLPVQYYSEIRDLIAEYGVVRQLMTGWPLSGGTDKPPRQGTRFTLSFKAQNTQLDEKSLSIGFASLETHKPSGILYIPREIREQSIVAVGAYIAKLSAIAAAQCEDETGLLGDGTATYDSISGVAKIASNNSKVRQLATAKTKPSDVTAGDFRALFAMVNSRVRATGVWLLNNTWEAFLPELNTEANQYVFRYNNAGQALLWGRPIRWTEVMQEFADTAAASEYITIFGDLSYWWFGTRPGGVRIDESADFKFDYDLISIRVIEELDFDYMATDAAAALQTGAGS